MDLGSSRFHEKSKIIPNLGLWVGKNNAIWIPDFDQPKKSNILKKAAINGIRAKIKSKIIDFGLQFQVSKPLNITTRTNEVDQTFIIT